MNKIKVLLIMIMMLFITGCYNYDMEMKINDDKSMDFTLINTIDTSKFDNNDSGEVTTGSAALSTANAEFEKYNKNLKSKGYNVEKYSDPNNSSITGMKITKRFNNIDYISKEGEPTRVNLSKIGEEDYDDSFLFTVKKGLVYNTYTATFVFGNEDANSSENAQIKNYESQMNVTYRVSLPVPAFSSNSNVINDDGKTLSWTLKPSEVNIVEYSFKIADQMNLYLAYGSAGLIILLIIIAIGVNIGNYRRKKQSIPKQPKEPKKSKEPKQKKEKEKKDKDGNVVNLMAPQEALTNENQNINLMAPQGALTNNNQMPTPTVIESPKPLHSEDGPAVIINAPAVTIEANGSNNSNPVLEQSQPVMEDNQSNETTIDNSQLQMPNMENQIQETVVNNLDEVTVMQNANMGIQEPIENTVLEQPQSVIEPELENVQPETSNQSQVIVPSVDEMFENANKTIDVPQQQIENNKEVGTMEYNFDFNNQTINSQLQNNESIENENKFVSTTNVTPAQDFTNVFDSNPVMEAPNIAAFENTQPQEQVINTLNDNTQIEVPVQNVEPNMGIQEPIENIVLEQPQSVIEPISQDIQIGVTEANNNQLQMSNMENQIQEPVVNNLNGEVPVMQNLQPNMEIEIEKIQEPLDNPILNQTQIEIPNVEHIDLKNEQEISNVVIPNVDISLPEVQINDQAVIPEFKPVNQVIEPMSMPETIHFEVPSNNNENKIEMPILPDIPDTDPGMEESKHRYITNVQIPTPDEDTIISDIVSEPTE